MEGAVYISSCQHTGINDSLAHSCTSIPHLHWREGGKYPIKPKYKHALSGYWGMLWKENDLVWIALEPWLNASMSPPALEMYIVQ